MARNVFYRDFTVCKAVALVGLIAAAWALGALKGAPAAHADLDALEAPVVPVVYTIFEKDCDTDKVGVDL